MNVNKIKQDIKEIMERYFFELNTEQTRKKMCNDLSLYLNREIIDKTTHKMIQYNQFDFRIKVNEMYIGLNEYLNMVTLIERKEKINKIMKKLWKE